MAAITAEHIDHWRQHGYVIVENLLSAEELAAARANIGKYLPSWEEYRRAPHRYRALLGSDGWPKAEFPFVDDALNHVTLHPELLHLAERLLGTDDIALSHARLRGKYAGTADYDQALHVDYTNNTLVYPNEDTEIFDLPFITYYTDVTLDLGPTHVLSRQYGDQYLPGCGRSLSRDEHPEAYEKSVPAVVPAGSTLIYSMRTFHRGSAMQATEGVRFSHHMSFRNGACRWAGQLSFQFRGGTPEMDRFIETATPREREVVGFPAAGDPYWTDQTLAGVAARYPAMDMTPYRQARNER